MAASMAAKMVVKLDAARAAPKDEMKVALKGGWWAV